MVLLTITADILAAIQYCHASQLEGALQPSKLESDLSEPRVGKPISHGQLIEISQQLRDYALSSHDATAPSYHLDVLLRGSQVYIAPVKPKAEPTDEYKELMARLRREEEARAYDKMTSTSHSQSAGSAESPPYITLKSTTEEDEITYADVNRQMALIINVLVSIIACSIAIWLVASHWSTPTRLALSLSGGVVVAVAEVAIYAGYLRKLQDAKVKEKSRKEMKTITDTWVIEKRKGNDVTPILLDQAVQKGIRDKLKFRKGKQQ